MVEVAGTFVCIAAFINIALGGRELVYFLAVLVLGLAIVVSGLPLRPRTRGRTS